jgi:hypothetical protein
MSEETTNQVMTPDNNVLILKVKMKGFLIAGIIAYIDLIANKISKVDSIVINGGSLLARFDVHKAHNILLDSLFSIKLRNEKYDVDYTKQMNELFMSEINTPDRIANIIKAAKNKDEEKIAELLDDVIKYTITNQYNLIVGMEFATLNLNEIESKESAAKEMIEKAYEIEPVTAPVKGTPVFNLENGDVIYVRFIDSTPMGMQIKQHLIESSNEEQAANTSGPKLLGSILEMIPSKQKSSKLMQIIVELTPEIFGKMELPVNVKIKKYDPNEPDNNQPMPSFSHGKNSEKNAISNLSQKPFQISGNHVLFFIIIFLIALLIYLIVK